MRPSCVSCHWIAISVLYWFYSPLGSVSFTDSSVQWTSWVWTLRSGSVPFQFLIWSAPDDSSIDWVRATESWEPWHKQWWSQSWGAHLMHTNRNLCTMIQSCPQWHNTQSQWCSLSNRIMDTMPQSQLQSYSVALIYRDTCPQWHMSVSEECYILWSSGCLRTLALCAWCVWHNTVFLMQL